MQLQELGMVSEKFNDEVKQNFLETNLSTIHEKTDNLRSNYSKSSGRKPLKRMKLLP
jgi:hypothetical protein